MGFEKNMLARKKTSLKPSLKRCFRGKEKGCVLVSPGENESYGEGMSLSWTKHSPSDGWLLVQERFSPMYPIATLCLGIGLIRNDRWGGGIDGLLARSTAYNRSSGTWSDHSDGMGNIMAMIDADGNVTAAYQYDPYTRLRRYTGFEARSNPFRFSTKLWLDFGPDYYGNAGVYNMRYGLYYYGYRYYSPALQRWLSRDPIREIEGMNLYSMDDFPRSFRISRKIECGDWKAWPTMDHFLTLTLFPYFSTDRRYIIEMQRRERTAWPRYPWQGKWKKVPWE